MTGRRGVPRAVVPAAGLGTRLLPATVAVPKELLPIGREPMLQRALREIREAGIVRVAVVVGERDDRIERFLGGEMPPPLREEPAALALADLLNGLEIEIVRQPEPRGLGDALGRTRDFTAGEPFAVVLPDNVFFGPRGALTQILPLFGRYRTHLTGLIRVDAADAPTFGDCGAVRVENITDGEYRVLEIGDKGEGFSSIEAGTETFRWYARHVLLPSFFEYLDRHGVERGGEIDDVPVLQAVAAGEGIVGKLLVGRGFDAGNERGLLAVHRYLWEEESRGWR